jgi:hypothetical protein
MFNFFKSKKLNVLNDKYKVSKKFNKIIKKTTNASEVIIKNNLLIFLFLLITIINYDKSYNLIKLPYILSKKLFFNLDNITEYINDI